MLVDFNIISDESRLWIYGSETKLTDYQKEYILKKISDYLITWDYHNNPLTAAVTIKEDHFIVVALDDSEFGVGGCSIDSLQRIIQDLENKLSISLLNRLNIFCRIDDNIECFSTFKFSDHANKHCLFYDLTIQKKHELSNWLKLVEEGWCANLIL